MKNVLIISDIHGRTIWKQMVALKDWDVVVFLGDYFDSHTISYIEQMANFKEIIYYARTSGKEVVLLKGNHCTHYDHWARSLGEIYTGFQHIHWFDIQREFDINKDLFKIAYRYDKYLFTHAGVTDTWLKLAGIKNDINLVESINDLYFYRPVFFKFDPRPDDDSSYTYVDGYGENSFQSPVWVRPKSLLKDSESMDLIQIIGHTKVKKIDFKGVSTGKRIYMTDTLSNFKRQFLTIENDTLTLNEI